PPAAEVYQKVTLYQFMPKFAIKPINIEARKYSQLRCSYLEEVEAEFHIEPHHIRFCNWIPANNLPE
ncbi:MAG: hypothetical protein LC633_04110, partial [Desulfobulbaceae bacterium]|nr:hypothetical protein [Desulfobulbaceae bacterium]